MISYSEAKQIILSQFETHLPVETVTLENSLGRVLAVAQISAVNLPAFDNSAMDGFALYCPEMGLPNGAEIAIQQQLAAGDDHLECVATACEIMTGAGVPNSCNAVVAIENVEILSRNAHQQITGIRLNVEVNAQQNIRRIGQDVKHGDALMAAGTRLTASHILLLSGVGVAHAVVFQRPKIALLCTGKELQSNPEHELLAGQIRNSNAPYLRARLQQLGAELVYYQQVADEPCDFHLALDNALQAGAEIVLSTGAVSMGKFDFIPELLQQNDADVLFHKVAIRPGKPILFARLKNGQKYFGLPGNPISSAIGLRFFVEPALRAMQGMSVESPLCASIEGSISKRMDFRFFQKAHVTINAQNSLTLKLLSGQESFKTQALLQANAWAVLPEGIEHFSTGDSVEFLPIQQESGISFE